MTPKQYYDWVSEELKSNKNADNNIDIFNYTSGMVEECAEFLKIINRGILHSDIDRVKLMEETGDFLWYLTACHCLKHGNFNKFHKLMIIMNSNVPKYMEVNALICDSSKLMGLYRKRIFFGREISEESMEEIYERTFVRFFHLISYFGFFFSDIAEHNKKKLDERYPKGRDSKYYIELNFREK